MVAVPTMAYVFMTNCTECNRRVVDDVFCSHCGKRLEQADPTALIYGVISFFNNTWGSPYAFPTAETPQEAWGQLQAMMKNGISPNSGYAVVQFKPADLRPSNFYALHFYPVEHTESGWLISPISTGGQMIDFSNLELSLVVEE